MSKLLKKFKIGDVVIRLSEHKKGYGEIRIGHIGTVVSIKHSDSLELDNGGKYYYSPHTFVFAKEHIFDEFMKKELS